MLLTLALLSSLTSLPQAGSPALQPENSADCIICCWNQVFPAPAVNTYSVFPDPAAQFSWTVSGNASIVGATTNSTVDIQAGPAANGSFTLTCAVTKNSVTTSCSKVVSVLDPPPPAPGGNAQAKIMLHLVPPAPVGCDLSGCCTFGSTRPCSLLTTKGDLYPTHLYYAALLVVNGETDGSSYSGIAGVECGFDYKGATGQGVDVFGFSLCGNILYETNGFPGAGSGVRILFDPVNGCKRNEPGGAGTGVSAQFGYFYLGAYSADQMRITTGPSDGLAKVIDCGGRETVIDGGTVHGTPSPLGYLSFSAGAVDPGYSPCDRVIPVENTTWSGIKGLFREPAKPENSDQR